MVSKCNYVILVSSSKQFNYLTFISVCLIGCSVIFANFCLGANGSADSAFSLHVLFFVHLVYSVFRHSRLILPLQHPPLLMVLFRRGRPSLSRGLDSLVSDLHLVLASLVVRYLVQDQSVGRHLPMGWWVSPVASVAHLLQVHWCVSHPRRERALLPFHILVSFSEILPYLSSFIVCLHTYVICLLLCLLMWRALVLLALLLTMFQAVTFGAGDMRPLEILTSFSWWCFSTIFLDSSLVAASGSPSDTAPAAEATAAAAAAATAAAAAATACEAAADATATADAAASRRSS